MIESKHPLIQEYENRFKGLLKKLDPNSFCQVLDNLQKLENEILDKYKKEIEADKFTRKNLVLTQCILYSDSDFLQILKTINRSNLTGKEKKDFQDFEELIQTLSMQRPLFLTKKETFALECNYEKNFHNLRKKQQELNLADKFPYKIEKYPEISPSWFEKEKLYTVGEYKTKEIVRKILILRLQKAKEFGYSDFGAMVYSINNPILEDYEVVKTFLIKYLKVLKNELSVEDLNNHHKNGYFDIKEKELKKDQELDKAIVLRDVLTYIVNRLKKWYGIILNLKETTVDGKLIFEIINGDNKSELTLDVFMHKNEVPQNAHANKTFVKTYARKKKGISDIQSQYLTPWELRTLLHEIGHFIYFVLNNKDEFRYNEFKELPSLFMEQLIYIPEEILSIINSEGRNSYTIKDAKKISKTVSNGFGLEKFPEIMKYFLDIEIHHVSDEQKFEDLIGLEKKIIKEFYGIIGEEIMPEYLFPEISSICDNRNIFFLGQEAFSYKYILSAEVASYLHENIKTGLISWDKIKELWVNPVESDLYKKFSNKDFFLNKEISLLPKQI